MIYTDRYVTRPSGKLESAAYPANHRQTGAVLKGLRKELRAFLRCCQQVEHCHSSKSPISESNHRCTMICVK